MKELYFELEKLFKDNKIHFDFYNNQLKYLQAENNTEDLINYPAVFVEFVDILNSTFPDKTQVADCLIRFYVADFYSGKEPINILDLRQNIHKLLQGFRVDCLMTPLIRKAERQDSDWNIVQCWQMEYAVRVADNSAMPVYVTLSNVTLQSTVTMGTNFS